MQHLMLLGLSVILLLLNALPAAAQEGTPTPDPAQLQQTADQLQAEANIALANAQAAVSNAQAAANAAAQAKIAAAEARQRANALEAQAATEKALLAEQTAAQAMTTAQTALSHASEAVQHAESALDQLTVAQLDNVRLTTQIDALQQQLHLVETTLARQTAELAQTRTSAAERIADLQQAIVWLGLIGLVASCAALRLAQQNKPRPRSAAPATASLTLEHDSAEVVAEPIVVDLSPDLRAHIERVLDAAP